MPSYPDLAGTVAVVTGAASGMGRASALAFGAQGASVVVADRDEAGGHETELLLRDAGAEAVFVPADVSRADDAERLVATALERFGRLDHAHNNAGIGGPALPTADLAEDDWDRVIAVNLKGIWLCLRAELRHMLAQGRGAIVNTASNVGLVGIMGAPAYVAAKHGVVGLTKVAALEYATSGVRVNCVCPGVVDTPMVDAALGGDEAARQWMVDLVPMKRMARPDEVAEAVLWLCSDGASFVNGHPLVVDAGQVWMP